MEDPCHLLNLFHLVARQAGVVFNRRLEIFSVTSTRQSSFVLLLFCLCLVSVAFEQPQLFVQLCELPDTLVHEHAGWLQIAHGLVLNLHQCFLFVIDCLLQVC